MVLFPAADFRRCPSSQMSRSTAPASEPACTCMGVCLGGGGGGSGGGWVGAQAGRASCAARAPSPGKPTHTCTPPSSSPPTRVLAQRLVAGDHHAHHSPMHKVRHMAACLRPGRQHRRAHALVAQPLGGVGGGYGVGGGERGGARQGTAPGAAQPCLPPPSLVSPPPPPPPPLARTHARAQPSTRTLRASSAQFWVRVEGVTTSTLRSAGRPAGPCRPAASTEGGGGVRGRRACVCVCVWWGGDVPASAGSRVQAGAGEARVRVRLGGRARECRQGARVCTGRALACLSSVHTSASTCSVLPRPWWVGGWVGVLGGGRVGWWPAKGRARAQAPPANGSTRRAYARLHTLTISSARMHPRRAGWRSPMVHSYRKRTPSAWGRGGENRG